MLVRVVNKKPAMVRVTSNSMRVNPDLGFGMWDLGFGIMNL